VRAVEVVIVLRLPEFLVIEDDIIADAVLIEELLELLIVNTV
jgi:hypothetical protein